MTDGLFADSDVKERKSLKDRKTKNRIMKNTEMRLISELLKNSRRSDRQLAKALGVSQPTISRMLKKVEGEGLIGNYTVIPDFVKLGFRITSLIFIKLKDQIPKDANEETRKKICEVAGKYPSPKILIVNGMGLDADMAIVCFHKDYSEYAEVVRSLKQHPLVKINEVRSFIIDLTDKTHLKPLSFNEIAEYASRIKEEKEPQLEKSPQ